MLLKLFSDSELFGRGPVLYILADVSTVPSSVSTLTQMSPLVTFTVLWSLMMAVNGTVETSAGMYSTGLRPHSLESENNLNTVDSDRGYNSL